MSEELIGRLGVVVKAIDEVSPVLKRIVGNLEKVQKKLGEGGQSISDTLEKSKEKTEELAGSFKRLSWIVNIASGVMVANFTYRIFGGIREGIAAVEELRYTLTAVASLINKINLPETFKEVSYAVMDLGQRSVYSLNTLALALNEVVKAGYDFRDAQRILEAGNKIATVSMSDLQETTLGLSNVMKAFAYNVEEVTKVMNILQKAADMSTANADDLIASIAYAAPVFKSAGLTLEDLAAATAILTNVGYSASTAGRYLRQVINSLIAPSNEAKTIMTKFGIAQAIARGEMKSFSDLLTILSDRLRKMSKDQKTAALAQLFGVRAGAAIMSLLEQNEKALHDVSGQYITLSDMVKELGDSAGYIEPRFEDMSNTLKGSAVRMQNALTGVINIVYDSLGPAFIYFNNLVAESMDSAPAKAFFKGLGEGFASLINSVSGFLKLMGTLALTIGGLVGNITGAGSIEEAMQGLGRALGTLLWRLPLTIGFLKLMGSVSKRTKATMANLADVINDNNIKHSKFVSIAPYIVYSLSMIGQMLGLTGRNAAIAGSVMTALASAFLAAAIKARMLSAALKSSFIFAIISGIMMVVQALFEWASGAEQARRYQEALNNATDEYNDILSELAGNLQGINITDVADDLAYLKVNSYFAGMALDRLGYSFDGLNLYMEENGQIVNILGKQYQDFVDYVDSVNRALSDLRGENDKYREAQDYLRAAQERLMFAQKYLTEDTEAYNREISRAEEYIMKYKEILNALGVDYKQSGVTIRDVNGNIKDYQTFLNETEVQMGLLQGAITDVNLAISTQENALNEAKKSWEEYAEAIDKVREETEKLREELSKQQQLPMVRPGYRGRVVPRITTASYQLGGVVKRTETAVVHKGEVVVSPYAPRTSPYNIENVFNRQRQSTVNVGDIIVNVSSFGGSREEVDDIATEIGDALVRKLKGVGL